MLQREQGADRNLRGAEHYESILKKRKGEGQCYGKVKNAALSGSRSDGLAPWQEKMNREAVYGNSLLQVAVVAKLEETIRNLLRE